MAEEGEGGEEWEGVWDELGERGEGVFEDEGADLGGWVRVCLGGSMGRGRTDVGLREARSIATAPPMDWP